VISFICATRGRTEFMKRMWNSALETADNPQNLEIVWFIDDDDTNSIKVHEEMGSKALILPRKSISLAESTNRCWELTKKDIIYCLGDDVVFRTKGWDTIIDKAFQKYPDKICLMGGADGLNKDLITHPIIHSNWVYALGRITPPYFRDCYIDTWMNEVAQMVGRIEWLPFLAEHMHFSVGKSPMDQTAKERMGLINQGDEAGQIFMRTKLERIQEAEKLHAYIGSFKQS
jgi:hypothetical protein